MNYCSNILLSPSSHICLPVQLILHLCKVCCNWSWNSSWVEIWIVAIQMNERALWECWHEKRGVERTEAAAWWDTEKLMDDGGWWWWWWWWWWNNGSERDRETKREMHGYAKRVNKGGFSKVTLYSSGHNIVMVHLKASCSCVTLDSLENPVLHTVQLNWFYSPWIQASL